MTSMYWSGPFDFDGIERHSWTLMDPALADDSATARQVGSIHRSGFGTPTHDQWEASIDFLGGYYRRGPFATALGAMKDVEQAIAWLRSSRGADEGDGDDDD